MPIDLQEKLEGVQAGTTHATLVLYAYGCFGWYQFRAPGEVA
jgi:hypothetical protein